MITNGRRLLFISLIFLFGNCEKEPKLLQLVFPVEEKGISNESVEFTWEYDPDIEVDFRLYEYTKEGKVLIEKNVVGNQITVNDLNPSTTYYWEVQFAEEIKSSEFTTFNPLTVLTEKYFVEIKSMYCNSQGAPGGLYTTSIYSDSLRYLPNDNGVTVERGVSQVWARNFIFEESVAADNELIYSANHEFSNPNEELFLYLNLDIGTVRMYVYSGSNGGGSSWECEFEY